MKHVTFTRLIVATWLNRKELKKTFRSVKSIIDLPINRVLHSIGYVPPRTVMNVSVSFLDQWCSTSGAQSCSHGSLTHCPLADLSRSSRGPDCLGTPLPVGPPTIILHQGYTQLVFREISTPMHEDRSKCREIGGS